MVGERPGGGAPGRVRPKNRSWDGRTYVGPPLANSPVFRDKGEPFLGFYGPVILDDLGPEVREEGPLGRVQRVIRFITL
jgi:hypothetical protein